MCVLRFVCLCTRERKGVEVSVNDGNCVFWLTVDVLQRNDERLSVCLGVCVCVGL